MTQTVRSDWQGAILICRKCSKRLGGGFGPRGKTRLAKALNKHLGNKRGHRAKIGIVEVRCLSACPENAVTVVSADDLLNWKLIPIGTPIDKIAEELGLSQPSS